MYVLFEFQDGVRKLLVVISGGLESVQACLGRELPACIVFEQVVEGKEGKDGPFRSTNGQFELERGPYCEPWFRDGAGFQKLEEVANRIAMEAAVAV